MSATRLVAGLVLVAALALGAASCAGEEDAFRLAVQAECQGGFTFVADQELAGAFLPLVERGARLAGSTPAAGIEGASVGGRPVEVKVSCTESFSPTYAVTQLRQLLEEWQPDAVVGSGFTAEDGFIVRDLAKRYPDVTFVVTSPTAQEVTLDEPAPNVFRVAHDNAQAVAGLGSYAYRELGWRHVAVVGGPDNAPDDWEQAAGFMAEFCSLGGVATRDDGHAWSDPAATAAGYANDVDGVAVISTWILPAEFVRATAKRGDTAGRILLGGSAVENHANLAVSGADLTGVAVGSWLPIDDGPAAWQSYLTSFARAYPASPPGAASGTLAVQYRNGVETIASALERVDGDPGSGGGRLREAISRRTVQTVPTVARFDGNGQLVSSVFVSRLGRTGVAGATTASVVDGVEQSYGGLFGPPRSAPTKSSSSCDQNAEPPHWAAR